MKLDQLAKRKNVFIKLKTSVSYRKMSVTKSMIDSSFTISNFGGEKIDGHEYLIRVNTQQDLDALDIMET